MPAFPSAGSSQARPTTARSPKHTRLEVELLERRDTPTTTLTTANWSGYAVTTAPYSVTQVKAGWVVPTVAGTGNAYSSTWVGIDGVNSKTIEQLGIAADIINGTPTYYAWYELGKTKNGTTEIGGTTVNATAETKITGFTVVPGYVIGAKITVNPATTKTPLSLTFSLTEWLPDYTTVYATFSKTITPSFAIQQSSAEWVEEAPTVNGKIAPLANFATGASPIVNFMWVNAATTYTGGKATPLGQFTDVTNPYVLQMFNTANGVSAWRATPSGLSSSGDSFNVGYSDQAPADPGAGYVLSSPRTVQNTVLLQTEAAALASVSAGRALAAPLFVSTAVAPPLASLPAAAATAASKALPTTPGATTPRVASPLSVAAYFAHADKQDNAADLPPAPANSDASWQAPESTPAAVLDRYFADSDAVGSTADVVAPVANPTEE